MIEVDGLSKSFRRHKQKGKGRRPKKPRESGKLHGMEQAKINERMDELFSLVEMTSFADKRNDSLSSGMKQKVSIARTLIHDPEVIMFDEPTTRLEAVLFRQ